MAVIIFGTSNPFEGLERLTEDQREGLLGLSVTDPLAQLILQWGLTNTVLSDN
jgi:hypothetical protein